MTLPPHSIRRYVFAVSVLWVLISIAAIIVLFIGEWDQYSHLDRYWELMFRDLRDLFLVWILSALLGVALAIYVRLSPRQHIIATIPAGVAAWGVGAVLAACAGLVGEMADYYRTSARLYPSVTALDWLMGFNKRLLYELSGQLEFTVVFFFVITGISVLPFCGRVVRRPASYALVGLNVGLIIYFFTLLLSCLYEMFLSNSWCFLGRFDWGDCAAAAASGLAFGYVFASIIRHHYGRMDYFQGMASENNQ